jgi:thiamine pyrophosphate-dependent acetolactate synthase large subunit-like protein
MDAICLAASALVQAAKPIIIAGSGVWWSGASEELRSLVEAFSIPCYTTPMTRGLLPDDHDLAFPAARSTAFREADCVVVLGTRDNYILNFLRSPVFSKEAVVVIEVNVNAFDISNNRIADVEILADARNALVALQEELKKRITDVPWLPWVDQLRQVDSRGRAKVTAELESKEYGDTVHPLSVSLQLDTVLPRDAVRIVDGHETLGFSRRGLSAYMPGRMLTPGVYGTMGVGVPFAIGAKVAMPDAPVVALSGDGAFGYHAMELDTAVRHSLGIVFVISNNGGWTGSRGGKPGRYLGYTDYSKIAEMFGCFGRNVDSEAGIAGAVTDALDYAQKEMRPAVINVMVSPVRSGGRSFSRFTRYGARDYTF